MKYSINKGNSWDKVAFSGLEDYKAKLDVFNEKSYYKKHRVL